MFHVAILIAHFEWYRGTGGETTILRTHQKTFLDSGPAGHHDPCGPGWSRRLARWLRDDETTGGRFLAMPLRYH